MNSSYSKSSRPSLSSSNYISFAIHPLQASVCISAVASLLDRHISLTGLQSFDVQLIP